MCYNMFGIEHRLHGRNSILCDSIYMKCLDQANLWVQKVNELSGGRSELNFVELVLGVRNMSKFTVMRVGPASSMYYTSLNCDGKW